MTGGQERRGPEKEVRRRKGERRGGEEEEGRGRMLWWRYVRAES